MDVSGTTKNAQASNTKLTSEQTLQETKKGFTTYLKTLSQPVDLLTRKNEIKHLEDQGELTENIKAIHDSLIASCKVTNGAVRAYYTTNTGHLITGWYEWDEANSKNVNKKEAVTGVDNTNKEWYTNCIGLPARNSIYCAITEPYTDSVTGKDIITVSQEIKYSSGDNYGTVAMDIEFQEMKDYVENIGLLNTGFVLLVNKDGEILVNNDKNTYVADSVAGLNFWSQLMSLSDSDKYGVHAYTEKIGKENVQIMASTDEITGWTLIGIVSEKETETVIGKITFSTLRTGIFSFIIGITIAIFVSMTFTREIKKVNAVMTKVAAGDLTQRIAVKKKNEFGVLETNFNEMIDNVSGLIRDVKELFNTIFNSINALTEGLNNIDKLNQEMN